MGINRDRLIDKKQRQSRRDRADGKKYRLRHSKRPETQNTKFEVGIGPEPNTMCYVPTRGRHDRNLE